ncbi:hypothetical protein OW763_10845 [Clostridium aestuarii]|uniref:Lipoprotein n=1 Tax=Clostridium aestuarii TaxID=338193 RepID=A0ABT4D476_9CLOT|nr:hypothetical protein [Clostridium aestuarii]MCY6484838.1 hypothetical protein [Clostridium aestuarii]
MRRIGMIIFSLILFITTFCVYKYETSGLPNLDYKRPSINIKSEKYGTITNIAYHRKESLKSWILFLGVKDKETSLYCLNVENGKVQKIKSYETHPNLKNVLLFNDGFVDNSIITAYDKGICKIQIDNREDENGNTIFEENKNLEKNSKIPIQNFENATSMDVKEKLYYTLKGDKLIYSRNIGNSRNSDVFHFMKNKKIPEYVTYYKRPYEVVNFNCIDEILSYTKLEKSGLNLYYIKFNDEGKTSLEIKNVVHAKGLKNDYGIIGIRDNQNKFEVFCKRRNDITMVLDKLDKNTDILGQVPDVDIITYNKEYTAVYTSFDEKHNGKIIVNGNAQASKVIVNNPKLLSPVRLIQYYVGSKKIEKVMFFTYENDSVKINICDIDGKNLKIIES